MIDVSKTNDDVLTANAVIQAFYRANTRLFIIGLYHIWLSKIIKHQTLNKSYVKSLYSATACILCMSNTSYRLQLNQTWHVREKFIRLFSSFLSFTFARWPQVSTLFSNSTLDQSWAHLCDVFLPLETFQRPHRIHEKRRLNGMEPHAETKTATPDHKQERGSISRHIYCKWMWIIFSKHWCL